MEDDPLALETRRRIYATVRQAPGIGGREIQRRAGTAWGETVYHLGRLTDAGLLHREPSGPQDHYFVASVPLGERKLLGFLRSSSARGLLLGLLELGDQTVPELIDRTGLSAGRISVHLRRLLECGVLGTGRKGRRRTFRLSDPEQVLRLLVTYREGLADAWVERLLETWAELFRP